MRRAREFIECQRQARRIKDYLDSKEYETDMKNYVRVKRFINNETGDSSSYNQTL